MVNDDAQKKISMNTYRGIVRGVVCLWFSVMEAPGLSSFFAAILSWACAKSMSTEVRFNQNNQGAKNGSRGVGQNRIGEAAAHSGDASVTVRRQRGDKV